MITNIFKKALVLLLLICFGFSSINPATSIKIKNIQSEELNIIDSAPYDDQKYLKIIDDFNLNEQSNPIQIVEIFGGKGITIEIKNTEYFDLFNISIEINSTNKFVRILSSSKIDIPIIHANELKRIKINLFGFTHTKPIGYNRIILTIKGTNITSIERIIIVQVIGYFVIVNTVYFNDQGSHDGYILYAPEYSYATFLINNKGEIVHIWKSDYFDCLVVHLLENGNLLRGSFLDINSQFIGGGVTGIVEMFDWKGTLLWQFEYSNNQHCLHHDIEPLPNGNILMIAWELKTYKESIDSGRNPLTIPIGVLWPCYIIEVEPILPKGGKIVWEWHVWDHLIQDYDSTKENYGVIANHPELIDINYGALLGFVDINHLNSLDYNEELDQILISSHIQNEIWVIDHNTTTEEAAGHSGGRYGKGGDLIYRWGNPQTYHAGNENDQVFFGQHDARWIDKGLPGEGNIIIFNNGFLYPEQNYSSIIEIIPPVDENGNYDLKPGYAYGPEEPIWVYTADNPTDFYAAIQSGVQRLPNGNTLICDTPSGVFFEVTPNKEIVWKYVNLYYNLISNRVDKIQYYPNDYPCIKDLELNNKINYS